MDLRAHCGRKELGRRIQAAIAQAGYSSLPAFAEELGCSRALIYQYIGGEVLVQLDRLCAIADLTGHALDWFISPDPNGATGEVTRLEEQLGQTGERCEQLEAALAADRGARLTDADAARRSLLEALQELCRAQRQAGDLQALSRGAARCEELARQLADEPALMGALLHAGHAAIGLGERDSAEEALRAALELAEELADERAVLSARQELVRVLQAAGHLEDAREAARPLLDAQRWWPRWAARVALAAIDEQAGELRSAEVYIEDAERVIAEADAPGEHARIATVYAQSNRANIALARGDYAAAAREADRLHELAAEAGLPDQVREATLNRAIVALRTGALDRAEELLGRLRDWAQMAGDKRLAGLAAVFEGERLIGVGEPAQARQLAQQGIELGNGSVSGQIVAEAELVLGMAYLADALVDDALYHLRRCRDRAHRLELRRVEAFARLQEGRALSLAGERQWVETVREARDLARTCGYEDLAEVARVLLGIPEDAPGEQISADTGKDQP